MHKITNLTNSPHDLMIRLPAMGSVEATFSPEYLAAYEATGYFEVAAVGETSKPQLDHDNDGKPGGVADPSPLTAEEEAELIDAMTDDELRDFIERKTGKKPHHKAGREKLLETAKETAAQ